MVFALLGPMLTIIMNIINEALDNKHTLRAIILDILKDFDNVWQGVIVYTVESIKMYDSILPK